MTLPLGTVSLFSSLPTATTSPAPSEVLLASASDLPSTLVTAIGWRPGDDKVDRTARWKGVPSAGSTEMMAPWVTVSENSWLCRPELRRASPGGQGLVDGEVGQWGDGIPLRALGHDQAHGLRLADRRARPRVAGDHDAGGASSERLLGARRQATLVSAFCAAASSRPSTLGTGVGVSRPSREPRPWPPGEAAEGRRAPTATPCACASPGMPCARAAGRAAGSRWAGSSSRHPRRDRQWRRRRRTPPRCGRCRRCPCGRCRADGRVVGPSRERAPASKERNSAASVGRRSGSRAPAAETISSSTLGCRRPWTRQGRPRVRAGRRR